MLFASGLLGAIFDSITLGNCEPNLFYNQTIGSEEAVQYAQNKKSSGVNSVDSLLIAKVLQFRTATRRVENPRPRKTHSWDKRVILREVVGIGRASPPIGDRPKDVDYIALFDLSPQGIFEKAAPFYESGMTLREIANEIGASKTTIRKALIDGGLDLRPSNRSLNSEVPQSLRHHIVVAP